MLKSWKGEIQVGAVEVVEIPEDYLKTSDTESRDTSHRQWFKSILRGLIHAEVPVAIRIERFTEKTRVFFLTWTRKQEELSKNLTSLTTSISAYLPKFILSSAKEFKGLRAGPETNGVIACLIGEPAIPEGLEQQATSIDPMDAAGELLQSLDNVILQVFIEPTKGGKRQVRNLERLYENAMERSQKVVSGPRQFSQTSHQSVTRVDSNASREAERLDRQIKRMSSRYLGKVSVTVTHWHQDKKWPQRKLSE